MVLMPMEDLRDCCKIRMDQVDLVDVGQWRIPKMVIINREQQTGTIRLSRQTPPEEASKTPTSSIPQKTAYGET